MSEYRLEEGMLKIAEPSIGVLIEEPFDLPSLEGAKETKQQDEWQWLERNGKMHGEAKSQYENGTIKEHCFYSDGKLHGPSRCYSEDGQLVSETWFYQGLREGKVSRWYTNGQIAVEQWFKEGVATSLWHYYFADGKDKATLPYSDGRLHGKVQLMQHNGHPYREAEFEKGERKGHERLWNSKGVLLVDSCFAGDQPIDVCRRYHKNGQLAEEVVYHNALGKFDIRQWNVDGVLLREAAYEGDDWTHKIWEVSGKLVEERSGHWNGKELIHH